MSILLYLLTFKNLLTSVNLFIEFLFFRVVLMACRSSQAWGQVRARTDSLRHSQSNARFKPYLCQIQAIPQLMSLWQCWILNPLSEARDRTCILMDTSWDPWVLATMGSPLFVEFFFFSVPVSCGSSWAGD